HAARDSQNDDCVHGGQAMVGLSIKMTSGPGLNLRDLTRLIDCLSVWPTD
ncbi:hypothetical protein Bpfe_015948, partial [Biomphalaria pfeifferi]